jgi:hypothetical protein
MKQSQHQKLLALERRLTLLQTENDQLKFQLQYNAFGVKLISVCCVVIGICLYRIMHSLPTTE